VVALSAPASAGCGRIAGSSEIGERKVFAAICLSVPLITLLDLPGRLPDFAVALPDEIFDQIDRYLEKWLAEGGVTRDAAEQRAK
jgi:hypothetical protein